MSRFVFHACPRCAGDLFREEREVTCVQCGHVIYLPQRQRHYDRQLPLLDTEQKAVAS